MERLRKFLETDGSVVEKNFSTEDELDNLLSDYPPQDGLVSSNHYRSRSLQKEMDIIDSVIDNLEVGTPYIYLILHPESYRFLAHPTVNHSSADC
jgi:hypothetical protein